MPSPTPPPELGRLVREIGRACDAAVAGGEFVGDKARCENVSVGEA